MENIFVRNHPPCRIRSLPPRGGFSCGIGVAAVAVYDPVTVSAVSTDASRRLTREPEQAFADHRAHDLVGTAGNGDSREPAAQLGASAGEHPVSAELAV